MAEFAQVGDFCPYEECPDYGKLQSDRSVPNIIKFGKTRQGRQRFRCKTCNRAFCETTGTVFHRRRTPEKEIIETLAWIAEGNRISSVHRVKGFKEDTILEWLRKAAQHGEAVEEVLMAEYQLSRGQLDGLWSFVRNKGEKKPSRD